MSLNMHRKMVCTLLHIISAWFCLTIWNFEVVPHELNGKILICASERALEYFHISSILCSLKVIFSCNDMLKWNMRASKASERFWNSDRFSLNLIEFLYILVTFLRILWISHEIPCFFSNFLKFPITFGIPWKIPRSVQNSLDFTKTRKILWKWKHCFYTIPQTLITWRAIQLRSF